MSSKNTNQNKGRARELVNRRDLMKGAGIAAAGAALSPSFSQTASAAGSVHEGMSMRYPWSKLACNIEAWYTDRPFNERVHAVAEAGFQCLEFWNVSQASETRDMNKLAQDCASLGINIIQFTGWDVDSLGGRDTHVAFKEAIKQAIETAHLLDAPMFTIVGHQESADLQQSEKLENLQRALESVVPILEGGDKMAILEPFNPVDHKGFFLNGSGEALNICRTINSPHIKINWDLYHMQLSEGNLAASMRHGRDQIGYIQVADVPGRHQPGTGELNYPYLFQTIAQMGYDGPIGLECWPKAGDEAQAIKDIKAVLSR